MTARHQVLIILLIITVMLLPGQVNTNQQPSSGGINSEEPGLILQARRLMENDQYDSAILLFNKAAIDLRRKGSNREYTSVLLSLTEAYRKNSNTDKADEYLEEARKMLDRLPVPKDSIAAEFLYQQSNLYSDLGRFEEAIRLMMKSVEIRKKLNPVSDSAIAVCYNSIGYNYFYLHRYAEAKTFYNLALTKAGQKGNQEREDIATYLMNIGIIYGVEGDLDKAQDYLANSLLIIRKVLPTDHPDLADAYGNIGRLEYELGKYDSAIMHFNTCESIYLSRFGDDYLHLGYIYDNKGNIYFTRSDFETALEYYRNALNIFTLNLPAGHPVISNSYNNIGMVYFERNDLDQALAYFTQSLENNPYTITEIKTLRNIAKIYQKLGDYEKAGYYYRKSIDNCRVKLGEGHYELGNSYLRYGLYLLEQDDPGATTQFDKSGEIFNKILTENHPLLALLYYAKAEYSRQAGDLNEAVRKYDQALSVFNIGSDFEAKAASEDLEGLALGDISLYIHGKARSLRALYDRTHSQKDLTASYNTYNSLIQITDLYLSRIAEESKFSLVDDIKTIYVEAIETSLVLARLNGEQKYAESAFRYAEKSKAAVLLASVRSLRARDFGGIPDSLQFKEQELRERIAAYRKFIYDENLLSQPDQKKIALWEGKLFKLRQEYDVLISFFETNYPEYHALKFNTGVIGIDRVQDLLNKKEILLEYVLTDTILYAFIAGNNNYEVKATPIDSSFYNALEYWILSSKKRDFSNHGLQDFRKEVKVLRELYTTLIKPVEAHIAGKDLIIIPDEILGYLSFDALLTALPDTSRMDYINLPYLIRDHGISYSHLATLHFSTSGNKSKNNSNILAFAPTYDKLDRLRPDRLASIRGMEQMLVPLNFSQEEVRDIQSIAHTDVYSGDQATESKFKSEAGGYGILHLAMHTLIDNENPMFSKLAFTLTDKDTEDDGFLNTYELYNMKLNASMVVLSACNTGSGKLLKGEGIISLARGFIYAGVPGLIMTLWAVEDKSGATIMSSFYKNLHKGMPKDKALREAKLQYIQQAGQFRSHPYFWSAYVAVGDTSAVYSRTHTFWWYLLACVPLLIYVALRLNRKSGVLKAKV